MMHPSILWLYWMQYPAFSALICWFAIRKVIRSVKRFFCS